jgi:hypothetical protein
VGAVGWSMAMAGRLGQAQAEAREAAGEATRLSEFLRSVGGQRILPARLTPTEEGAGGGRALVYTTGGRGADWALVLVDGLPSDRGPYTASLIHGSGIEVPVGRLSKSGPSQLSAYRFFVQDLAGFRDVVVTDRLGAVVLRGSVQQPG